MRPTPRKGSPRNAASANKRYAAPGKRAATPRAAAGRAATRPSARGSARPSARPTARTAAKAPATGSMPSFLSNKKPVASGGVASARPSAARRASGPVTGKERRERHQRAQSMKVVMGVIAGVFALGLAALLALVLLRDSSVFSIDQVTADPTAHVTADDIQKLLKVDAGSTLLNLDEEKVEAGLKKNPWVASVSFEKEFPHTLKVVINEQVPDTLVVMTSGSIAWYMGQNGCWIEPCKISVADGESVNDAALAVAQANNVTLITGVPASVSPEAGAYATDSMLATVKEFREGFSSSFASQIVSYDAPSSDAISCVLSSGVEVSLGSATNINYKEQVAASLIAKYPNQLTYINVRTPSNTTVRKISSSDVTAGTAASGTSATESSTGTSASSSASSSTSTSTTSGASSSASSSETGETSDE